MVGKQERYAKNEFSSIDEMLTDDDEDGDQISSLFGRSAAVGVMDPEERSHY